MLKIFLIGLLLIVISGYFGVSFIYAMLKKGRKLKEKEKAQRLFYLLVGFSPFYFWLAVFLLGLLLTAGGAGFINLKM